jgi:hypothetical protein
MVSCSWGRSGDSVAEYRIDGGKTIEAAGTGALWKLAPREREYWERELGARQASLPVEICAQPIYQPLVPTTSLDTYYDTKLQNRITT